MNKIQHIYGNGCSFTNDDYIRRTLNQPVYLDLLAEQFGTTVTNGGLPGACNRRIIRNTLRAATEFDQSTLVLVQLTMLQRTEKPYNPGQDNAWKMLAASEEYHESIKGDPFEKLNKIYFDAWFRFFDEKAEITNLATDLLLLSTYLESRNIPYLIFSYLPLIGPRTYKEVCNDRLQVVLAQNTCVLNILSGSLIDRLAGDMYYDADSSVKIGHLSPDGHKAAADVLANLIVERVL